MLKLLNTSFGKGTVGFSLGDSVQVYEENLKKQDEQWPWRTRPVTYTTNSQGFRCIEFEDIDWSNSVVCFGCSNTFGLGVSDGDTWVHRLGKLLNLSSINLGQCGQGWGFNWVNSLRVLAAGIRPRAVVYYWPTIERMFTLSNHIDDIVVGHGGWNSTCDSSNPAIKLGLLWAQDSVLSEFWAMHYFRSLDILWKQISVPQLHLTWAALPKIPGVEHVSSFPISSQGQANYRARDLIHPGFQDHSIIAFHVFNRLKSVLDSNG